MARQDFRKFKLTFADLIRHCNNIHTAAARDVDELSAFGIDKAFLDSHQAEIDISSLSPGVYFVSVGGKMYKFVKI